jgi:hypothetical protein
VRRLDQRRVVAHVQVAFEPDQGRWRQVSCEAESNPAGPAPLPKAWRPAGKQRQPWRAGPPPAARDTSSGRSTAGRTNSERRRQ